jgi:hypothetical protein
MAARRNRRSEIFLSACSLIRGFERSRFRILEFSMTLVCREIEEHIEETVWEPVEEWVERREERCRQRSCRRWCLCCNKWFCWIETFLVKVVTWVAKTVTKFSVRTVCETVAVVLGAAWGMLSGFVRAVYNLGAILWNLITLDWNGLRNAWRRFVAAITDFGTALADLIKVAVRLRTGGFIAGFIREEVNENRLKAHVRRRLDDKFADDAATREAIKARINLNSGPFGLDFPAESLRAFVDSRILDSDRQPFLFRLHQDGDINIYELAGFDQSAALDRPRTVAKKVTGEALTRQDVDRYLETQGLEPHFLIFAVTGSAEREKLNVAADRSRQIGLKLRWTKDTIEVRGTEQIEPAQNQLAAFLMNPVGRSPEGDDACTLASVAVFTTAPDSNGRRPFGFATWKTPTSPVSGVVHRDRLPSAFFKYVMTHEIGHYFSLQHEGHDGLDKIMYSPVENSWWSWNLILEFLWWSGEPRFTLDDGKRTWDFLIDELTDCLIGAQQPVRVEVRTLSADERRIATTARVEE